MSKIIKWATYEGLNASKILKQHAFHSVSYRNLDTGFKGQIVQSLCGLVRTGGGPLPAEATPMEDIDAEVLNLDTACQRCLRMYEYKQQ